MIARLWRRLFRRPTPQPDRLGRTEECECGEVMPVADAHLVIAAVDDPESGGGTAVSAAFCPAHCPGGCSHPKEHTS